MDTQLPEQLCEAGGLIKYLQAPRSDVTIVTKTELLRSVAKLRVEAWIAANHDSVRRCRSTSEGVVVCSNCVT
jgi:hypothetical protein